MSDLFILAGNGPYDNRGCEAIVRGTVRILRRSFDSPRFLVCSQFASAEHLRRQQKNETDPAIRHVRIHPLPTLAGASFINKVLWKFYWHMPRFRGRFLYKEILSELPSATAVLSIGGDNYSLDYDSLINFTDLDDLVLGCGKKLVIWGASVGPFSKQKKIETAMTDHLNRLTAIFARESKTIEYLKSIGVEKNVHRSADPAFLLDEKKPDALGIDLEGKKFIGINLHPLMAKFVSGGDREKWRILCVEALKAVLDNFESPVLLIPHVADVSGREDDYLFMKGVHEGLKSERVFLLPATLDAAETKWVIARCRVFAGARTHATLAAFSSGVPTLCFGYSLKAEGLSRDLYGNTDFCLSAGDFNKENVVDRLKKLLQQEREIRERLGVLASRMEQTAFASGAALKALCG